MYLFNESEVKVENCIFDTASSDKFGGVGLQTNPHNAIIDYCKFMNEH